MPLTPESWIATAAFLLVAAIFAATAASKLFHQRWTQRLAPLDAPPDAAWAAPVHVSVVIAARDEAAGIEGTVSALLAQQGVALEVIVVSDRSTDDTADVVRRLGGEDPRVRVIEVTALPERWIGKCHACYTGAAAATGDWILFTDADCRLAPDVIARALAAAAREGADHVALTPAPIDPTLGAKAWYLVFGASITNWISAANRDLKDGHFGIGAFNMVRASTYRACGGYEALRLTILDDVRLSLLVRRAGGRSRIYLGGDDVLCNWATSVGECDPPHREELLRRDRLPHAGCRRRRSRHRAALRDAARWLRLGHVARPGVRPVAVPAEHPGGARRAAGGLVACTGAARALLLPAAHVRDAALSGPDTAAGRRSLA